MAKKEVKKLNLGDPWNVYRNKCNSGLHLNQGEKAVKSSAWCRVYIPITVFARGK